MNFTTLSAPSFASPEPTGYPTVFLRLSRVDPEMYQNSTLTLRSEVRAVRARGAGDETNNGRLREAVELWRSMGDMGSVIPGLKCRC